jgi:hypothetical protein
MTLKTRIGPAAIAAALGLAGFAHAGAAQAAVPTCLDVIAAQSTPPTHVIYGAGGSAITPTLAAVAYALSQASPPLIVFYSDPGAQSGFEAFRDHKAGTSTAPFKYWITADALTAAAPPTCTAVDTVNGQAIDFGTTGGSLSLFGDTLPDGVAQFTGPAQGVNIVVPPGSTQTKISAEALFFVYGFGDASQYAGASDPVPWTNPLYIFQRKSTAFVQQFIRGTIKTLGGTAANFPATFVGTQTAVNASDKKDSNQGTVDSLIYAAGQGFAENGIGFTSGPTADKNRPSGVHTLAYQHVGQNAAYWPDSGPDAFDKINIRTGQYYLWDVNLFFAKVSGSNLNATIDDISNGDVKNFIGYFSGAIAPPADADVNRAIVTTGSIPLCAMRVQRASDFAGLSCYAPSVPCGCYFESIATKTDTCDTCDADVDCTKPGASKCHYGFCEAY